VLSARLAPIRCQQLSVRHSKSPLPAHVLRKLVGAAGFEPATPSFPNEEIYHPTLEISSIFISIARFRFILFTLFRTPAAATRADPGGAGS
jgi:hypothetical protein